MLNFMFGVPFFQSKVDKELYEKSTIVKNIAYNFSVDPDRNMWDNVSKLHHSYNDDSNVNFKPIPYGSLMPLYKRHVEDFLNVYFDDKVKYSFEITNYTCMSKGQYMSVHNHPSSSFTGIHYIKFDASKHNSTLYENHNDWSCYINFFYNKPMIDAHSEKMKHSWIKNSITLNVEEDDLVITPSILQHSVSTSNFDALRMAIVFHIYILEME